MSEKQLGLKHIVLPVAAALVAGGAMHVVLENNFGSDDVASPVKVEQAGAMTHGYSEGSFMLGSLATGALVGGFVGTLMISEPGVLRRRMSYYFNPSASESE